MKMNLSRRIGNLSAASTLGLAVALAVAPAAAQEKPLKIGIVTFLSGA
jgi:ABC-type sugar transport system substrate-binding protein